MLKSGDFALKFKMGMMCMYIKRDRYLNQLISRRENGLIKVITGIMRCGKSYLLFNIFYDYLISTGVKAEQIIDIALDDDTNAMYRDPAELFNCLVGYATETNEVHTGGTAACTAKSICKNEYGELDLNNHTSDKYANGFRNCCGEYQPATLTTDKYDIYGDSIKDNVYEIGNAAQLYWFAGLVNGTLDGVAQDKYANAVLTEDIIVNDGAFSVDSNNNPLYNGYEISEANKPLEWIPIGIYYDSDRNGTVDSDEYAFYYGTLDGNNHTVSGLYINNPSHDFIGLFGRSCGTIKNVGVINSYFNGKEFVGGVCGDGSEIINCYNAGMVSGTEFIGGVCGHGYAVIVNCYNTGNVTDSSYTGEICYEWEGRYVNNYYLADSDDGNGGKTAAQFASGEVVCLLSQGCTIEADDIDFYEDQTFSGEIWGQTLSGDSIDAYPILNGKKVYYGYLSCAENAARVYTNDSNALDMKPDHTPNADDGDCMTAITCSVCGTVTTEAKESHVDTNLNNKCDSCGTVMDGIGEIGSYSLNLTDDIGVNFYMKLTLTGADSTTWTITYSPMNYVKSVLEADKETRTGAYNLMKALYYYNQAAITYFEQ